MSTAAINKVSVSDVFPGLGAKDEFLERHPSLKQVISATQIGEVSPFIERCNSLSEAVKEFWSSAENEFSVSILKDRVRELNKINKQMEAVPQQPEDDSIPNLSDEKQEEQLKKQGLSLERLAWANKYRNQFLEAFHIFAFLKNKLVEAKGSLDEFLKMPRGDSASQHAWGTDEIIEKSEKKLNAIGKMLDVNLTRINGLEQEHKTHDIALNKIENHTIARTATNLNHMNSHGFVGWAKLSDKVFRYVPAVVTTSGGFVSGLKSMANKAWNYMSPKKTPKPKDTATAESSSSQPQSSASSSTTTSTSSSTSTASTSTPINKAN